MKLGVDGKFVDSALAVRTLIVYISRWGGGRLPTRFVTLSQSRGAFTV
jgi:hypothetical protein